MRSTAATLLLLFSTTFFLLLPIATSLTAVGLSLLALKSAISSDPTRVLSAWKDSDPTPCNWLGISCVSNRVSSISLPNRRLSGYIPSEIGFLRHLTRLSLPHNNFSNSIPSHLFNATSLVSIDLSHNSLAGPIPTQIKSLKKLAHLDLSSNLLNGSLPSSLSDLTSLSGTLNLSYNLFSGSVPDSFGRFPVWLSLDLRHNNLSGPIPQMGSLLNQGPTAFAGNPSLCGFPLRSPCSDAESPQISEIPRNPESGLSPSYSISPPQLKKGARSGVSVLLLSVLVCAVGVVSVSVCMLKRRRRGVGKEKTGKGEVGGDEIEGQKGDLYVVDDEGGFGLELEELLRASAYVVGKSRNGIVYKVVVGRGVSVAVRRLGEGGPWKLKEFETEVEAIARVRHRNIVRTRAYYYATDEKLLVTDFISNGTLHGALHGGPLNLSSPLSWAARLKIAQGAARGLAHIHECSPRKYVHGNIKSSKVLLDDDFNAYISGFGLNRLVSSTNNNNNKSIAAYPLAALSGSELDSKAPTKPCPSYLAPEARASSGSKLTQKCDVYSFGIVLLEVLTGRLPDLGLESFVREAFRKERPLSEVVDPLLLHEVCAKKQVLAVFHVALGCTEIDPERRPRMRAVSDNLDRIG